MFPLASAPLASSGSGAPPAGGPAVYATLTESIVLNGYITQFSAAYLGDGITFDGSVMSDVINVLLERLTLTGTVLPSLDYLGKLTDSVRYNEALKLGWLMAINEDVTLAGAAAGQRTTLAVIADALHALGAVNTTLDARVILSTVIALSSMMAAGWRMEAIDTVEFEDALRGQLTAITKLVDAASFADTVGPALRIVALATDEVDFGSSALPSMELFAQLADQVMFYTVIRLGETEYAGWVLNDGAVTEYRNYPFNGFLEFNGRYFGTSDSGLYEIGGATDAGVPIDWNIKTALMDFATGKLKRVPDCYLAIAGSGDVYLRVVTTEQDGKRHENIYRATLLSDNGKSINNERIKIGRGLSARYYQFELAGTGPMELDEMAWRPLIMDRRL